MRITFAAGVLLATGACVPTEPPALSSIPPPLPTSSASRSAIPADDEPDTPDDDERFTWATETQSPRPLDGAPTLPELAKLCPAGDAALAAVAKQIAERQAAGRPALDTTRVGFSLRAAGSPYVWPRIWSIEGATLDGADTGSRVQRWLASFHDGGERRCGFEQAQSADGKHVIAAVAVDALADLDGFPIDVRAGQWLTVKARLLDAASEAHVVVLGPTGPPRTVTTELDGAHVRATFAVDRPGAWLVQVVASGRSGPRPVVEAMTFADEKPPVAFHALSAPGEQAAAGAGSDESALEAMVDAARQSEGLASLARDPRLDAVAQSHAEAMLKAKRIGHDVGDGDPGDRIRAAALEVKMAGENVAHARTVRRAHRALWASPSHRGNLLESGFRSLGVGVARDPDGSVWVCEVLADFR